MDVSRKFYWHTYVLQKPEYELPYQAMTDEELIRAMRISIKNFCLEYAGRQQETVIYLMELSVGFRREL